MLVPSNRQSEGEIMTANNRLSAAKLLIVLDSSWQMARIHRHVRAHMERLFEGISKLEEKRIELSIGLLACGYGVSPNGELVLRIQTLAGSGAEALKTVYSQEPNKKPLFTSNKDEFIKVFDQVVYQGAANHAVTLDTALDFPFAPDSESQSAGFVFLISDKVSWSDLLLRDGADREALGLASSARTPNASPAPEPASSNSVCEVVSGDAAAPLAANSGPMSDAAVEAASKTEACLPGTDENRVSNESSQGSPASAPSEPVPNGMPACCSLDMKSKALGIKLYVWNEEKLDDPEGTELVFDAYFEKPIVSTDCAESEDISVFITKLICTEIQNPEKKPDSAVQSKAQFGQDQLIPCVPFYLNTSGTIPATGVK